MDSEPTKMMDEFTFLLVREKWRTKIERVTSDKSTIFGWHAPPIQEENTKTNKTTQQNHIINHLEALHAPLQKHGASYMLARAMHYLNGKLHYHPWPTK
jgi:hypothetical protein